MKKFFPIFAAFSVLFVSACTSAGFFFANLSTAGDGGYSLFHADYGRDPSQKLDIYSPKKGAYAQDDVIIFIHGGRWQSGDKKDYRFVGTVLAARGFVVVIPNYRQYPDVRFPDFVQDVAKAAAWVDDNIESYGGRRDRIHLAGHSSGAHIGALLVADERYLATEGKRTRKVLTDFAGLAGPYAFRPGEEDLIDIFGPPEQYPQMQVTTFINGQEPPMLLMYGKEDNTVAAYNHERLAAAIKSKGGKVIVRIYPGLGHIGMISTFANLGPDSSVVDDMADFFRGNDHED